VCADVNWIVLFRGDEPSDFIKMDSFSAESPLISQEIFPERR
jgi:hypothetical protein